MDDWRDRLIDDDMAIRAMLAATRTIAVLGIKTEAQEGQPAFDVPRYLAKAGYEIIPVPVYFPEATRILDQPVRRTVAEIEGRVDIVNVFRRAQDLPPHLDDLLAAAPGVVWLQQGIRDDAFAEQLARAGILVVQDRCLMVDHRRLLGRGGH